MPDNSNAPLLSTYRCSPAGIKFIFAIEVGPHEGDTDHLHWPGGASGVTLGPGYDMKERTSHQIANDLAAIKMSHADAKTISAAAGLGGDEAASFAKSHALSIKALTHVQQIGLLTKIVPHYERIVRAHIKIPLRQHETDALVCFVYNPGGHFAPIAHQINTGQTAKAMTHMLSRLGRSPGTRAGLLVRRKHEVNLYLHGVYEFYRHHSRHHRQRTAPTVSVPQTTG
jgi:hypothetical protein